MLAVRFEEVVSRGAGAAVALFSGAVIREMYRTKILSVKVCPPTRPLRCLTFLCVLPLPPPPCCHVADRSREISIFHISEQSSLYCIRRCCMFKFASLLHASLFYCAVAGQRIHCLTRHLAKAVYHVTLSGLS